MSSADLYPLLLLVGGILFIFWLILRLRVNAFLALIGAALLVGFLSPRVVFQTPAQDAYEALHRDVGRGLQERDLDKARRELHKQSKLVEKADAQDDTAPRRLQLLNAPQLVAFSFGDLMGRIGLAIAFATIVGRGLMESGAADRIVRAFVGFFGERFGGFALLVSGFILSIPVFFDTVFLLLVPLAKALYLRTGKNYLQYVTAIGAGGAITHSLVPPTPGPIGMANLLSVDLGLVILVGLAVGAPLALLGYGYAVLANRLWPVQLRETAGLSLEELQQRARREDHELPGLGVSLLPIVLPVLFITSSTIFDMLARGNPSLDGGFQVGEVRVTPRGLLTFLGAPNVALLISALVAMALVAWQKRLNRRELSQFTAASLDEAGMILLITCAGGAFGAMLKAVGVGDSLGHLAREGQVPLLVLAWSLAAVLKIAQGSGTVSMITTASIVAAILSAELTETGQTPAQYLGYHPVYLVMAIGCGSKIGSWMNDSGYWVVCKMGGLTEAETYKSWTVTLVLMGSAGLPLVWLLTKLLPLT